MTKAKKQLSDLIENRPQDVALPSKNAVRRAVHKINSEMNIITKIIDSLKGVYAMTENNEETNTVIYTLDKELEDIGYSVDVIIEAAFSFLALFGNFFLIFPSSFEDVAAFLFFLFF